MSVKENKIAILTSLPGRILSLVQLVNQYQISYSKREIQCKRTGKTGYFRLVLIAKHAVLDWKCLRASSSDFTGLQYFVLLILKDLD